MVAAQRLRARDFVPAEEHEEAAAQLRAAKEQLVEAVEELAARDRELEEVGAEQPAQVLHASSHRRPGSLTLALDGALTHARRPTQPPHALTHSLTHTRPPTHPPTHSIQVSSSLSSYQGQMQQLGAQVTLLYR